MVRAVRVVPLTDDAYSGPRSFGGSGSGRRVMGKVPSLVFDLDDLAEVSQHAASEHVDEASLTEVKQKLLTLLDAWSEPEYMLLLHVRFAKEDAAKRGLTLTVAELADTLRRLGYAVKLRTALGGGPGGACLRSLRHSFLTVSVSSPSGSMSYVLDPRFRDQFEIAHSTPRYSKVLEAVGQEVVTSQDRLIKVVELLCAEMALAFQETGTPLPPWRQQAAMLSKWQPRRSEEVDLTAAMNNGSGLLQQQVADVQGAALGAKRMTGPSTVAQRLMMLGVHQQGTPSPIDEGVEGGSPAGAEAEVDWDALGDRTASTDSSASSLHLGDCWEEEQAEQDTARSPPAPPQQPSTDAPRRTVSGAAAIPGGGGRGHAILEGIRAAAAALPHRLNNTWAG